VSSSRSSGSRLIGWDTPSVITGSSYSLYGKCATKTTIGHTGWTGTMTWVDRGSNLFVVLLTNRSFDPRSPEASFKQLKEIRVLVSDAARRASGERC
jgi:CubicO group peptidase (beta-lactamase class C family)